MLDRTLLIGLLCVVSACQGSQVPAARPSGTTLVPEMLSGTEEGFHDLAFAVSQDKRSADGLREITALATHQGRPVGFLAVLPSASTGVVTIRSVGPQSDALVQALDTLYGSQVKPTTMVLAVRFAAITLGGDPTRLEAGEVAIKLFFESEDEDRYAELYLNIDLPRGRVELREKDEEYRAPVVRALALGEESRGRPTKG